MIILDGGKLKAFWNELARGFERDPLEVIIWIILVLCLIIIPAVTYMIHRKIKRLREIKIEKIRFNRIINTKNLAPLELGLIHELKTYFNRIKITDILTSSSAFNSCVKKMLGSNKSYGKDLAKLRYKLGLSGTSIKSYLHSTAELFPNIKVKVHSAGFPAFKSVINSINGNNIEIKSNYIIKQNKPVIMEIERDSGCYLIHTTVSGTGNRSIKLNHSEQVEHVQNRNYFRKRIRLPVILKTGIKEYLSYLIDLSGGGAKIKNSDFEFKKGENLRVAFNLSIKDRLVLNSKVERFSKDRSSLSVQFNKIKEAERDRLIKLVLH